MSARTTRPTLPAIGLAAVLGPPRRRAGGCRGALGHDQGDWSGAKWYPPADLTDEMFHATAQGGYGLQAPDFFWSGAKQPPPKHYVLCSLK